jgi:hypothetical protein
MRHKWDKGPGNEERTCERCGAVLIKSVATRDYAYYRDGIDGNAPVTFSHKIPQCKGAAEKES